MESISESSSSQSMPIEADAGMEDVKKAPVEPESVSGEVGGAPTESESGPMESESGPMESEVGPMESESGPMESESGPMESESGPMESESGPMESESGPMEPESAPGAEDTMKTFLEKPELANGVQPPIVVEPTESPEVSAEGSEPTTDEGHVGTELATKEIPEIRGAEEAEDEEADEDSVEEEEEEEEEEEVDVGTKRRSSRARKSVETMTPEKTKVEGIKILAGEGLKLGDIGAFTETFGRLKVDSVGVRKFHIVLYKTIGVSTQRKRQIREYCGVPSDMVEDECARMIETMSKMTLKDLSSVLSIFGKSVKTPTRAELTEEFAKFLTKPNADWPTKATKRGRRSVSPRPPSALALYTAERTAELEGKTAKEISSTISKEWRSMDKEKKQVYVEKHEVALEKWKARKEEEPTKRQKVVDE